MATVSKDFKVKNNISIAGTADTATAASHYFVETASDGVIRPKTLANVKSELFASPTLTGTITTPLTTAGYVTTTAGGVLGSVATIPNAGLTNSSLTVNGTAIALGASGTVTAAAGTLTGTVLNATVVTSSLTAVGTITTGVWNAGAVTSSGAGVFTSTISASGLAGSLLSSANPVINGTAAPGTSAIPSRQDHVHPTDTSRAPLASPTFTGKVTTAATATGGAGFNLPHGTAPSAPVNGDVWTTTAGMYARINGTTVGPFGTGGGGAGASVSDTAPVGPTNGQLWFDSTSTKTYVYYQDGTSNQWVQVGGGAIIATNLIGGNGTTLLGSMPYQSGTDTTTLLAPNTSATRAFLGMTGTGTNGAAPSWTSSTGTGNVVLATSPTLTTPNIGVATGTSFNSITGLSSTTPIIAGTAAVGTGTTAARGDHVHPTEIPSQTGNSGRFLTTNGTATSWAAVIGSVYQSTAPTATTGAIWTDSDINVLYQYNGTAWVSPMGIEVFTPTFTTNNYTTVLADQSRLLLCGNGATAATVTISSGVAYPIGTQIQVVWATGTGQITLAQSGVTINSTPGLKLRALYSSATLIKTAATTWLAVGDLIA